MRGLEARGDSIGLKVGVFRVGEKMSLKEESRECGWVGLMVPKLGECEGLCTD